MIKLAQRVTLVAIVVVVGWLNLESLIRHSQSSAGVRAKEIVAQRYPLRARSSNFYNRSKISYTRGK